MNLTEKLPKYIAAIIAFGTFVGIIHNVLFYRFFHINYFAFADFTEVLNVFLPSVFLMITLLAAPFADYIVSFSSGKPKNPNPFPFTNNTKNHTFLSILFTIVFMVVVILFLVWINSLFVYSMLGIGFISGITSGKIQRFIERTKIDIPYYKVYVINMVVMVTIVSFILPFLEVKYNILSKTATQVSVTMKDSTVIKTDSVNFYINQTKNYLFMYNKKTDLTTVYKTDDVKKYEFKRIDNPNYRN